MRRGFESESGRRNPGLARHPLSRCRLDLLSSIYNAVIAVISSFDIMATLTVRNLPDEVHRSLRARAALHGRSTEAEVRALLEEAVKPPGRLKLGSMLSQVGRKVKLTDEEVAVIGQRDPALPRSVSFE